MIVRKIMEIKLKKQMKYLQKEVTLKSIDLNDDIADFKIDIGVYEAEDSFIAVSSRCIRCNICFEECPFDAISPSSIYKRAKIKNNCVKCEICAKSCPVSCINVLKTKVNINGEEEDIFYELKKIKVPHRILRMENISIDRTKCEDCNECIKFCPTNAITLKDKSIIEIAEDTTFPYLEEKKYPFINEKLCIGCGSCVNLCQNYAISLKRFLGPIIPTKNLSINQDYCVQCLLCEENCPVDAIHLNGDKIVLDEDKCIKCDVCSTKCPVGALDLKKI